MFFTKEDILKILAELTKLGVKDSQFRDANTPLDNNDIIVLSLGGRNAKIRIQDFLEQLHLLSSDDFINVTTKFDAGHLTLTEAIRIIPYKSRKVGLTITFQNIEDKWEIWQYTSSNLNQWDILSVWENCKIPVNPIVIPDEEDLTLVNKGTKQVMQFKDKNYNPEEFSGKGRVYLRKNITKVQDLKTKEIKTINLLTQKMLGKENTTYIIQYDYDLNGATITVPTNCTLKFEGGKLNNGCLVLSLNFILGDKNFFSNISLSGAIKNDTIISAWFDNVNQEKIIESISLLASNRNSVRIELSGKIDTSKGISILNTKSIELFGGELNKVSPTYLGDNLAIYIVDSEVINIHDIKCSLSVNDKTYVSTDVGNRYYCIWTRFNNTSAKRISIRNCIFEDKVGLPNKSVKPYNGTIWIGTYANVSYNVDITNNLFINSCGRVAYVTNCENVSIRNNYFINSGYSENIHDNYNMELICVRLIGCYNNIVTNNIFRLSSGAKTLNKVINITNNDNTEHNISDHSVITGNILDLLGIGESLYAAFYLKNSLNMVISDNEIILPSGRDDVSVLYYNGNYNDTNFIRNIVFKNNTIRNAHKNIFKLFGLSEKGDNKSISDSYTITYNTLYANEFIEHMNPLLGNNKMSLFYCKDNNLIVNGVLNSVYHGCNYYEVGSSVLRPTNPVDKTTFFNSDTRCIEIYSLVDHTWMNMTIPMNGKEGLTLKFMSGKPVWKD